MFAMQYGVRSIPALIFFKDGQPVDQIVGAVPKGALKKKIDYRVGQLTPRADFIGGRLSLARWVRRFLFLEVIKNH